MKKRVLCCLMIAVMAVTMCSCGDSNGETPKKNNEIELTLDNYSDYLNVAVSWYGTGKNFHLNNELE